MPSRALAMLRKLVRVPLNAVGLEIHRTGASAMPRWTDRVRHARQLGFSPSVAVDGGAYDGTWTREVSRIFPGIQILAIEANPLQAPELTEA